MGCTPTIRSASRKRRHPKKARPRSRSMRNEVLVCHHRRFVPIRPRIPFRDPTLHHGPRREVLRKQQHFPVPVPVQRLRAVQTRFVRAQLVDVREPIAAEVANPIGKRRRHAGLYRFDLIAHSHGPRPEECAGDNARAGRRILPPPSRGGAG